MSLETNKLLVRGFYELFNTGKVDAISCFVSEDYVEVRDGVRHASGVKGACAHVHGVRETYGNLRLTVEQQIAEGPWVVTCLTMRGIHRGEWEGIEPTGSPVEMTAVNIDKVVRGLIVEHGGAANMLFPLLQIGAVRVVGPADP